MDLKNFDISQIDLGEVAIRYLIPWGTNFIVALAIFLIGGALAKLIVRMI